MGSIVARAFVEAYPERATGMVLIGAFASLHASTDVEQVWEAVKALDHDIPYAFAREFQVSTLATPIPDDFLAMAIAETQKTPARVFRDALGGLIGQDLTTLGAHYRGPTAIVWGDKDVFCTRDHQDALLFAFKGAHFIAYKGIGH